MNRLRILLILLLFTALLTTAGIQFKIQNNSLDINAGQNVNMVAGTNQFDGDPWLQRQNEPSIAVSTRNPYHLLAGANDYRTVDIPIIGEELPGLFKWIAAGDAWLGVFKSVDGGQSWKSAMLPGYPQDVSPEGIVSPLKGLIAAADPTVRAGTNGLFYYSGIAFERVESGRSVIFVARFVDNNNIENGDSIEYIDTTIIDEGTSGQFADKPWLAVDIPRSNSLMATIPSSDTSFQSISCGNVYLVYSVFVGDMLNNVHNKIMFARSTDCGNNWEKPIKLSESQHVNQGTTVAIDPNTGEIYVAWRRFASGNELDAMLITYSDDFGKKFTKPKEVTIINPFDQGTTNKSFRTSAFPSMTVDNNGIVYLAWAERGIGPEGDARIVVMTSNNNGNTWTGPMSMDNHPNRGHQIMPSLNFASGKLKAAWYDLRNDASGKFTYYIDDAWPIRHTMDVRSVQALPGMSPIFGSSIQVSRYLWALFEAPPGNYYLQQVQFNPPNYPLFKQGTVPFTGDYIDTSASPGFILDGGTWRFNMYASDPSDFHVAWTDNRDVNPPSNNIWTNYTAPKPGCIDDNTGMRNQNVYTSKITQGIEVGTPCNYKPLGAIQRSFVVYVKNQTAMIKSFRMTLIAPNNIASFLQFSDPPINQLDVTIPPHSSISRPIFVESNDPHASVRVEVFEITQPGGNPVFQGLQSYLVLNPDNTNPDIVNPGGWDPNQGDIHNIEIHNPDIANPDIVNLDLINPNIANPNIENPNIANPDIANPNIVNPDIANPNIANPDIANPDIENPNIANPDIANPDIANPDIANGSITDIEWKVKNKGNTASSYTFKAIAGDSIPEGLYTQLLIYRVHYTPAAEEGCTIREEPFHELVVNIANPNIANPDIANPDIANPDIANPDIENATFFLAPGEEAIVALRVIDPGPDASTSGYLDNSEPFDIEDYADNLGAAVVAQSANTGDSSSNIATTSILILTSDLPDGIAGVAYEKDLKLFGFNEPFIWSWFGSTPPGLDIDPATGKITGIPTTSGTFDFTVQVADSNNPSQITSKDLRIFIIDPLQIITSSPLTDGVKNSLYNFMLQAAGGISPYFWNLPEGSILPPGLTLSSDGTINGTLANDPNAEYPKEYTFIVEVLDSGISQLTDSVNLTLRVSEPLEISTTSLPEGVAGLPYNAALQSFGGVLPYSWNLSSAPAWLFLSPEGALSGIPPDDPGLSYPVTYSVTIELSDSGTPQQYVTHSLNLVIIDSVKIITPSPLTSGTKYSPYNINLQASGGFLPYIWSLVPGNELPPGLAFGSDGSISGTPTVAGSFDLNIRVTDSYSPPQSDIKSFSLFLAPLPIIIQTDSLPEGMIDSIYETTLGAINGEGVLVWSLVPDSGDLPPGLSLSSDGIISGTPEYDPNLVYPQVYTFDVQVVDSFIEPRTDVKELSITVKPKTQDWLAKAEGVGTGETKAITTDPSGNVYVTGFRTTATTGADFYTVKYSSSGEKLWDVIYDNPAHKDDIAMAITVNSTGVYVTGHSEGKTSGFDYYTVKYSLSGNMIWDARLDGPANMGDYPTAITVDSSGNTYVTGYSYRGVQWKHSDYWTVKYDSNGSLVWEDRWDARRNGNDEAWAIAFDSTGVYVTGKSEESTDDVNKHDYYTVKYSFSGEMLWDKRYDGPAHGNDEAVAMVTSSSGIYITGKSMDSGTGFDYCTIKYDPNGNNIWDKRYDGPAHGDDEAVAIGSGPTGIYITGKSFGSGTGFDYCTIKYDPNGNQLWDKRYDGPAHGDDVARAVGVDSDENIFVSGFCMTEASGTDYFTIKLTSSGTVVWEAGYNGPTNLDDIAVALVIDPSGNIYVTGFSQKDLTSNDLVTLKFLN